MTSSSTVLTSRLAGPIAELRTCTTRPPGGRATTVYARRLWAVAETHAAGVIRDAVRRDDAVPESRGACMPSPSRLAFSEPFVESGFVRDHDPAVSGARLGIRRRGGPFSAMGKAVEEAWVPFAKGGWCFFFFFFRCPATRWRAWTPPAGFVHDQGHRRDVTLTRRCQDGLVTAWSPLSLALTHGSPWPVHATI